MGDLVFCRCLSCTAAVENFTHLPLTHRNEYLFEIDPWQKNEHYKQLSSLLRTWSIM